MKRKSEKFPILKPTVEIDWSLSSNDRLSQKQAFSQLWLQERTYHRYRYVVEKCNDGKRIYVTRPTRNHGLDFEVRVEGFRSSTRTNTSERPSHTDIVDDLKKKLSACPEASEDLFAAIGDVYDCIEPAQAIDRHPQIRDLNTGLPVDKLLRIIKWLFIEQDLTYWLGTGRNMLMCGLENEVFGIRSKLHRP